MLKKPKQIKSDFYSQSINSSRIEIKFSFKQTRESSDIMGSKSRKILFKISNELKRLDFLLCMDKQKQVLECHTMN